MASTVLCCADFGCRQQQAPRPGSVEITGGYDGVERAYKYQIKNRGQSPVVYVEIPHYRADSFEAPQNWTEKSTNLVVIYPPADPGVCTATARSPEDGIAPGRSANFRMHQSLAEAVNGKRDVKVRFADGREEIVSGVEVSVPVQSRTMALYPAIVLGLVLLAFAVWRARRPQRAGRTAAPPREEVV
jgi:hypothetical protein